MNEKRAAAWRNSGGADTAGPQVTYRGHLQGPGRWTLMAVNGVDAGVLYTDDAGYTGCWRTAFADPATSRSVVASLARDYSDGMSATDAFNRRVTGDVVTGQLEDLLTLLNG